MAGQAQRAQVRQPALAAARPHRQDVVDVEQAAAEAAAAVHLAVRRDAGAPQQRGGSLGLALAHQAPVPLGDRAGVPPADRTHPVVPAEHHAPGVGRVAAHLVLVHALGAAEGAPPQRHRLAAPPARRAGPAAARRLPSARTATPPATHQSKLSEPCTTNTRTPIDLPQELRLQEDTASSPFVTFRYGDRIRSLKIYRPPDTNFTTLRLNGDDDDDPPCVKYHHKIYHLKSIHIKVPSEHSFGNIQYPMELQLNHVSKEGEHLGVAFMVKVADCRGTQHLERKEMLRQLLQDVQDESECEARLGSLISKTHTGFYFYEGSTQRSRTPSPTPSTRSSRGRSPRRCASTAPWSTSR